MWGESMWPILIWDLNNISKYNNDNDDNDNDDDDDREKTLLEYIKWKSN